MSDARITTLVDNLSYKKECADSGENGDSKCIPLSHLEEIVTQRHKMSDIEGECLVSTRRIIRRI